MRNKLNIWVITDKALVKAGVRLQSCHAGNPGESSEFAGHLANTSTYLEHLTPEERGELLRQAKPIHDCLIEGVKLEVVVGRLLVDSG